MAKHPVLDLTDDEDKEAHLQRCDDYVERLTEFAECAQVRGLLVSTITYDIRSRHQRVKVAEEMPVVTSSNIVHTVSDDSTSEMTSDDENDVVEVWHEEIEQAINVDGSNDNEAREQYFSSRMGDFHPCPEVASTAAIYCEKTDPSIDGVQLEYTSNHPPMESSEDAKMEDITAKDPKEENVAVSWRGENRQRGLVVHVRDHTHEREPPFAQPSVKR